MNWFIVGIGIVVVAVIALVVFKKKPKKLKTDFYVAEWKRLQSYCSDKTQWNQAISEADALLDNVLKRRRFKGKSMGERMVSAQRRIQNNDQLWFAHNLAKKTIANPELKLKEADVKTALVGFRQALKDLGALAQPKVDDKPVATEGKAVSK